MNFKLDINEYLAEASKLGYDFEGKEKRRVI
jgi:hypothetical protein